MIDKMCPHCGKGLSYNEKTGLFKCRNGKCGRRYTLTALSRRNTHKSRMVRRTGTASNRSGEGKNERDL